MHKTNPKVELKLELTQVEGFGVGIFLRSVILEREVITTTYRQKGQVDGRGGEILDPTFTRRFPPSRVVRISCNNIELFYVFG